MARVRAEIRPSSFGGRGNKQHQFRMLFVVVGEQNVFVYTRQPWDL